jgi:hypothetical protein
METELLQHCKLCDSDSLGPLDPDCNIAQCRTCGYVFDNPRPTLQELISFYSRPGKYDSWLEEIGPRNRLWKRRLKKLQSTKKPGSLLDVGTGIGQFLSVARTSYHGVYGTEVSATAVESRKKSMVYKSSTARLRNLPGKRALLTTSPYSTFWSTCLIRERCWRPAIRFLPRKAVW